MLYSATTILYILVEAKHGRQGPWFPIFLTIWLCMMEEVLRNKEREREEMLVDLLAHSFPY
jgi:hypothetical protein